jgi:hypothetical protein
VRHTAEVAVLDALCRGQDGAAALVTVYEGGPLSSAALRTPGRPVLVSARLCDPSTPPPSTDHSGDAEELRFTG